MRISVASGGADGGHRAGATVGAASATHRRPDIHETLGVRRHGLAEMINRKKLLGQGPQGALIRRLRQVRGRVRAPA